MPEKLTHNITDKSIELLIIRSSRAKRIRISLDHRNGNFSITAPVFTPLSEIKKNITLAENWIAKHTANIVTKKQLKPNDTLCIYGTDYAIEHVNTIGRAKGIIIENKIRIYCKQDSFNLVAVTFIKRMAKQIFTKICEENAKQLEQTVNRISIRDTIRQWGSCSEDNNISLSWRLILAPKKVAIYVCVHEVCHLVEMNHSQRFWGLVASLCPDYKKQIQWLKVNGKTLHKLY